MLPGKRFWVTVGLGKNGDENQALQLPFKTLVYVVGFEKAIMRVLIKINSK